MDILTTTIILKESIWLILKFSLPLVGIALVIGVIISFFQALTQIQEMTLTFMPKFLTIMILIVFLMPWMGTQMNTFFHHISSCIIRIGANQQLL